MASRYMHVPDELKREIAGQVAGLLWTDPAAVDGVGENDRTELTDDQKAGIRFIAQSLPPYWRRRIEGLLDDGEGPAAVSA